MVEDRSSRFKFDADRPEPESFYREELKDMRLEKLNNRVTFITVLIPCLIGILLFFVYRDLTGRVSQTEDTGLQEVQKLSQRIDEKMTDMAARDNDLAVSITQKLENIDSRMSGLEKKLDQTGQALSRLDETKIDKADQSRDIERIEEALVPIREELQTLNPMREELKALAPLREEIDTLHGLRRDLNALNQNSDVLRNDLTEAIAAFTGSFEKTDQRIIALQEKMEAMAGSAQSSIDQQKLDLELLRLKKSIQLRLFEVVTKVEERLKSIESRLDAMQQPAGSSSGKLSPSRSGQDSLTKNSAPINEQDLKE
jgi:chromosome segregation ATPase